MTEKRFIINSDYLNNIESIIDNETGIEHDYLEIGELLNGLNEEKEMWRKECERLKGLYYLENEDEHLAWKRVDVE